VSVDGWVEEARLFASDANATDLFGYAVSINTDRAVVSAISSNDAGGSSGSAYVFLRDDNGTPLDPRDDQWFQEAKLTASDAAGSDQFGVSVSISSDLIVVGALGDVCPDGIACGAVYIFRFDGIEWLEEQKLIASERGSLDQFGWPVSIDGNVIVVGARYDDDAGEDAGTAYIFRLDDNGTPQNLDDDLWIEDQKLIALDATAGDQFGGSIFISGNRTIIGNWGPGRGAYVFRNDDNGTPLDPSDDLWIQEVKLSVVEPEAFGSSVSINNDTAIVGARNTPCADGTLDCGSAYVYRFIGNSWHEVDQLVAWEQGRAQEYFGASVSVENNIVVVGAYQDDCTDGSLYCGSAYIYNYAFCTYIPNFPPLPDPDSPGGLACGSGPNYGLACTTCDAGVRLGELCTGDDDCSGGGVCVPNDSRCSDATCGSNVAGGDLINIPWPKNRYIGFMPPVEWAGKEIAIRVTALDVPSNPSCNGEVRWAGIPVEYSESAGSVFKFQASSLGTEPVFIDWTIAGLPIQIYGEEINPGSLYSIQALI